MSLWCRSSTNSTSLRKKKQNKMEWTISVDKHETNKTRSWYIARVKIKGSNQAGKNLIVSGKTNGGVDGCRYCLWPRQRHVLAAFERLSVENWTATCFFVLFSFFFFLLFISLASNLSYCVQPLIFIPPFCPSFSQVPAQVSIVFLVGRVSLLFTFVLSTVTDTRENYPRGCSSNFEVRSRSAR